MATGSSMPPMLSLRRSAQSGATTLAAAYQTLYTESSTQPFLFMGAVIDLSNMLAGDIVGIRVRKVLTSGGAWIVHNQLQYTNAQPAAHPEIHISSISDLYGIEISAIQTVGALIAVTTEIFDAKRIGLT